MVLGAVVRVAGERGLGRPLVVQQRVGARSVQLAQQLGGEGWRARPRDEVQLHKALEGREEHRVCALRRLRRRFERSSPGARELRSGGSHVAVRRVPGRASDGAAAAAASVAAAAAGGGGDEPEAAAAPGGHAASPSTPTNSLLQTLVLFSQKNISC